MKNFKQRLLVYVGMGLLSTSTFAQDINLLGPVQKIEKQITSIFPYIGGILFVIVALMNLGHFTKEGGDWKKGLMNIIIFVVVIGAVAGLYSGIKSISLG